MWRLLKSIIQTWLAVQIDPMGHFVSIRILQAWNKEHQLSRYFCQCDGCPVHVGLMAGSQGLDSNRVTDHSGGLWKSLAPNSYYINSCENLTDIWFPGFYEMHSCKTSGSLLIINFLNDFSNIIRCHTIYEYFKSSCHVCLDWLGCISTN